MIVLDYLGAEEYLNATMAHYTALASTAAYLFHGLMQVAGADADLTQLVRGLIIDHYSISGEELDRNADSPRRLKKAIRSAQRSMDYKKNNITEHTPRCMMCQRFAPAGARHSTFEVEKIYFAPCCGSVLHRGCNEDLQIAMRCPICTSFINSRTGTLDLRYSDLHAAIMRRDIRYEHGIDEYEDMPPLPATQVERPYPFRLMGSSHFTP